MSGNRPPESTVCNRRVKRIVKVFWPPRKIAQWRDADLAELRAALQIRQRFLERRKFENPVDDHRYAVLLKCPQHYREAVAMADGDALQPYLPGDDRVERRRQGGAREHADHRVDDPAAFFEAAGVGLSSGVDFGLPGWVRLNFGCPQATLDAAFERMRLACSENRGLAPTTRT